MDGGHRRAAHHEVRSERVTQDVPADLAEACSLARVPERAAGGDGGQLVAGHRAEHERTTEVTVRLQRAATVVHGFASLRNKLGDAHGKGKNPVKAAPRHAQLAVNLAGATAAFLLATFEAIHGDKLRAPPTPVRSSVAVFDDDPQI